jgi:hypothetical protein
VSNLRDIRAVLRRHRGMHVWLSMLWYPDSTRFWVYAGVLEYGRRSLVLLVRTDAVTLMGRLHADNIRDIVVDDVVRPIMFWDRADAQSVHYDLYERLRNASCAAWPSMPACITP